jgi:capsular polysaccharide export protein
MKLWTRIEKIISGPRRLRQATLFQAKLLAMHQDAPLSLEEMFPDNGHASHVPPRLILLTSESELHGRRFFIESLGAEIVFAIPSDVRSDDIVGIFGYDDFLSHAERIERSGITRILFLEAGFLRGILMDSSGSVYDRAWCFFVDDLGFHYDANVPSRLELLINDPSLRFSVPDLERAAGFRKRLVDQRLTKYNDQRVSDVHRDGERERVLVVEQARRDWAIIKSGGGPESFEMMLQAAISQNPGAEIIVKVHPDTLNGKRGGLNKSYFGQLQSSERITVIKEKINPLSLLESVDKVYVFSSMLGFEALMMGKEVHLFGKPCYGGWGLTVDYQSYDNRTQVRSLDELVYIIYFLYQKYKDTDGNWCDPEDMISELLRLRDIYLSENEA